jgi:Trypsin
MKLIVLTSILFSAALAQALKRPLKFDHTKLKSVWSSKVAPNLVTEKNREGRILNGTRASPGQFPYHVLLVIDGSFLCGGSIIQQNWILTVKSLYFEICNS